MDIPYKNSKSTYPGKVTQKIIGAFALDPNHPSSLSQNFIGYVRNQDPTTLSPDALTFPSINCFIPNKDKIVPRLGTTLLGQAYTTDEIWPVIGHKKRFTTIGGYEVEVRVVKTDDSNLKDIVEVLLLSPVLFNITYNTLVGGPYTVGEIVTGATSGATGIVVSDSGTVVVLNSVVGIFMPGETITGGSSGTTANVVSSIQDATTGVPTWYQMTENVNPLPVGLHRYYMDDWFDTNLDSAVSLKLSRLVWVNGLTRIFSWTGGIAPIVSIVANTSISTTPGKTWASLGFIDPALDPSSSGDIIINGIKYNITGGWSTNTLLLASTAGISLNNVALSEIQNDASVSAPNVPFDMCRGNKNYMFYGNWNSQQLYMSNGFNRPAVSEISQTQAVQNDLVLGTSPYTGLGAHKYRVTIDSVNPEVNLYTVTGASLLDDAVYDTTGYNAGPQPTPNVYVVNMLADFTLVVPIIGGTYTIAEMVTGLTSGAKGVVVAVIPGPTYSYAIKLLTPFGFESSENVQGSDSTLINPVTQALFQNWIQYSKNGIAVPINNGSGPLLVTPLNILPTPLTDGLTITFANFFGHLVGNSYQLTINLGTHDTYQWQIDGATPVATGVAIVANAIQTLTNGITISFVSQSGHTIGDTWEISVNQAITLAWTNFYYTLPIRRPGEGYLYQLSANFWTMAPQESEMYVNNKFGKWAYIETVLSADLQSETVLLTPLKQVSSSKVIFPYMTSYLDDTLIYVTENKTLDMIGRKELLQLPQTTNLSQPVALDFQEASFIDGSMEYLDKKLFITSPRETLMLVYDNQPNNKYWQPPQIIPENGILSIVGNTLITHSNLRNQSFNLFTGKNGDNGSNYTVRARTGYLSYGNRWGFKNSNASFVEGYITGAPPMVLNVILGINGCGGIFPHNIEPVVCISPDQAPHGEGNFGSHQNGSDTFNQDSHFNEIYERFKPILEFRFASLELSCVATNHSYAWLSFGLNAVISNRGNNDLKNREIITRE